MAGVWMSLNRVQNFFSRRKQWFSAMNLWNRWGILLLCLLLFGGVFFLIRRSEVPEIKTLTYQTSGWGVIYRAAEIDFDKKEKRLYTNPDFPKNEVRSLADIPVRDFQYAPIKEDAELQRELAAVGIHHWKEHYDNGRQMDGDEWSLQISYQDGSQKVIHGKNDQPRKYDLLVELLFRPK